MRKIIASASLWVGMLFLASSFFSQAFAEEKKSCSELYAGLRADSSQRWQARGPRASTPENNRPTNLVAPPEYRWTRDGRRQRAEDPLRTNLAALPDYRWTLSQSRASSSGPRLNNITTGLTALAPEGRIGNIEVLRHYRWRLLSTDTGGTVRDLRSSSPRARRQALGVTAAVAAIATTFERDEGPKPYGPDIMASIYRADAALYRWHNQQPTNLDWLDFFISSELAEGDPREAQRAQALAERLRAVRDRARARVREGTLNPEQQIQALREDLFRNYLRRYCIDRSRLLDYGTERCGNCEAQTRLIVAMMLDAEIPLPEGTSFGVQIYSDHIQPVLYWNTDNPRRVIDLVSGNSIDRVEAPIFDPHYMLYGYLYGKGIPVRRPRASQFLRVPADENLPEQDLAEMSRRPAPLETNSRLDFPLQGQLSAGRGDRPPSFALANELGTLGRSTHTTRNNLSGASEAESRRGEEGEGGTGGLGSFGISGEGENDRERVARNQFMTSPRAPTTAEIEDYFPPGMRVNILPRPEDQLSEEDRENSHANYRNPAAHEIVFRNPEDTRRYQALRSNRERTAFLNQLLEQAAAEIEAHPEFDFLDRIFTERDLNPLLDLNESRLRSIRELSHLYTRTAELATALDNIVNGGWGASRNFEVPRPGPTFGSMRAEEGAHERFVARLDTMPRERRRHLLETMGSRIVQNDDTVRELFRTLFSPESFRLRSPEPQNLFVIPVDIRGLVQEWASGFRSSQGGPRIDDTTGNGGREPETQRPQNPALPTVSLDLLVDAVELATGDCFANAATCLEGRLEPELLTRLIQHYQMPRGDIPEDFSDHLLALRGPLRDVLPYDEILPDGRIQRRLLLGPQFPASMREAELVRTNQDEVMPRAYAEFLERHPVTRGEIRNFNREEPTIVAPGEPLEIGLRSWREYLDRQLETHGFLGPNRPYMRCWSRASGRVCFAGTRAELNAATRTQPTPEGARARPDIEFFSEILDASRTYLQANPLRSATMNYTRDQAERESRRMACTAVRSFQRMRRQMETVDRRLAERDPTIRAEFGLVDLHGTTLDSLLRGCRNEHYD